MKILNLNLNYKVEYKEGATPEDINLAQAELSKSYIEFAVASCFPKGLNGQMRRLFGRIQTKLDEAVKEKTFILNLEDKEIEFLQGVFKNDATVFNSSLSRYVNVLEDEILGVVKE